MYVGSNCYGLFLDVNNTLFCSLNAYHQVVSKSLSSNSNSWIVSAGVTCSGSASNALYYPHGIFVDATLNLYVADCGNNRIQKFQPTQLSGVSVAGSSASGTITLNCPTSVVLDYDTYLFIVDSNNDRIIGSGPNGFQCIIGCSGSGSASNQLSVPQNLFFDSYGNLYVTDRTNNRVQKFLYNGTSCGILHRLKISSVSLKIL